MKSLFIAGVEYLTVTENLGRGDRFGNVFRITNDKDVIRELLPPTFVHAAGELETQYLLSGEPVIYCEEEFSPQDNAEALNHLALRLKEVGVFLHLLWYERDNAVCTDLGYFIGGLNSHCPDVHRSSFGGPRCTATGDRPTMSVSRQELRRVRERFEMRTPSDISESTQILEESLSRWARADYFVQGARASADNGIKIANYCTALEALFSTDNLELSHKLAERIAFFVENDPAKRLDLYRSMKRVYSVRSKVVHGVHGGGNLADQIRQAATICDDICRRSLVRILAEEYLHNQFLKEEPDEGLEDFFLKRIFGGDTTPKRGGI